jgi:hypothetical protein
MQKKHNLKSQSVVRRYSMFDHDQRNVDIVVSELWITAIEVLSCAQLVLPATPLSNCVHGPLGRIVWRATIASTPEARP